MKKSSAASPPIRRAMPPLGEACVEFRGFRKDEKRLDRIYELLSLVIQRSRRAVPQKFYTMREVAAFFRVSLDTVSTVYRRLDREGALTRLRSVHTVIPARTPRPRFAVRGVVAMPIWLPGFLKFLDWRKWVAAIEEEMSRHHFVVEPVFFKLNEEGHRAFIERVLKFNPDYVLWFCPVKPDTNFMLSFTDAGIPLLVVHPAEEPFPGRCYPISYDRGLRQGLAEWETSKKVDRIVVPHWSPGPILLSPVFQNILKTCSLPVRFETYWGPKAGIKDYLARLMSKSRAGFIFADDLFYCRMGLWEPEIMRELFLQHRAMVMRNVVIPCGASIQQGTVDSLFYQWKQLARRIASDLSQNKGSIPARQAVFQAEWRAGTPLAEAIQDDAQE